MSVVLSPLPKMRFFDDDGLPLDGGKLYTYELGTTTPLTTYQDLNGTYPNANPVILDSEGRCSVWLDAPCTFVLYDKNDVLTSDGGDVDPITGFVQEEDLTAYYTKAECDYRYYTQAEVDAIVVGGGSIRTLKPGDYIDTAGDTAPAGSLVCDGAEYSRTTYDDLYTVIGDRYGEGNGTTTFNVPDWRGLFPRCKDGGAGVDPNAADRTDSGDGTEGDNVGTLQEDDYKSHQHKNYGDSANINTTSVLAGTQAFVKNLTPVYNSGVSTEASGGDETRPKNMYQLRCIVY